MQEVLLVEDAGRLMATSAMMAEPMTTRDLLQLIDESREWPWSTLIGAEVELVE
jgi:hypothetical protein